MGRPGQGLDGGVVLRELELGFEGVLGAYLHFSRPNHQLIIIAPTRQLRIIKRVLQPTNLLPMPIKTTNKVILASHIPVQD